MKRKFLFLLLLALLLIATCSCERGVPDPEETTAKEEEVMPSVSFRSDLSAYESDMDPTDADTYLVLINKENKVDASFVPEPLVAVKDARKDIELEKTAARALEAMFIEMRACGITNTFVTSAYRTYAYQDWLFHYYIEDEMSKNPSLTRAEARERVLTYSAEAGTSEHQSGLAADLMTNGMSELDESFEDYAVFAWLSENAWKFGFVLRFPEDKTDITGYDYEPWHYRFVGREHAYKIWSKNLCLEEYLG